MDHVDEELDGNMDRLVRMLIEKMGRIPTEDEVMAFIFGTDKDREKIVCVGNG